MPRKRIQRKRRRGLEGKSSWCHNNHSFHHCYFSVALSTATTPVLTQQMERYMGPGGLGGQSVTYKRAGQSKCPSAPERKISYFDFCRNPGTLRSQKLSTLWHSTSRHPYQFIQIQCTYNTCTTCQGTGRCCYCDGRTSQPAFC